MVMAKAPEPGRVKTRMTRGPGALSPEGAAKLQACCIRDLFSRSPSWARERVMWRRGALDAPVWTCDEARGWVLKEQATSDLGENLKVAFAEAAVAGPALVLGTDSPDVPAAVLGTAAASLGECDLTVGPTFDGGYYALGTRSYIPQLFEGIAWGGATVFEDTIDIARALGLRVHVLPFWHDADEVADLRRLRVHSQFPTGGLLPFPAAHTLEFVHELGKIPHGYEV